MEHDQQIACFVWSHKGPHSYCLCGLVWPIAVPVKLLTLKTTKLDRATPGKQGIKDWQAQVLQQGQQPCPWAPGVYLQLLLLLLLAAGFIALLSALHQPLDHHYHW